MTELLERPVTTLTTTGWQAVCRLVDLEEAWGEAALVAGRSVALFRTGHRVYAVDNHDPATGAPVIARGITGSKRVGDTDRPTIASPLHKQVYDLETGECYGDPALRLPAHRVRVVDGIVEVAIG